MTKVLSRCDIFCGECLGLLPEGEYGDSKIGPICSYIDFPEVHEVGGIFWKRLESLAFMQDVGH